jgi:hypothetical protein
LKQQEKLRREQVEKMRTTLNDEAAAGEVRQRALYLRGQKTG